MWFCIAEDLYTPEVKMVRVGFVWFCIAENIHTLKAKIVGVCMVLYCGRHSHTGSD